MTVIIRCPTIKKLPLLLSFLLFYLQVSSDKEVLRHETEEQKERVLQLEKSERALELDNERLAFKVEYESFCKNTQKIIIILKGLNNDL